MRDTGIKDKIGRMIRENDIVTFMAVSIGQNESSAQTGYVKWSDHTNQWGILSSSVLRGWKTSEFLVFTLEGGGPHEVIGRYPQDIGLMT